MASTPTFVSVWFGVGSAVVVGIAVGEGDGMAGMICDAQFNANAATKLTMIVLNVAMANCAELFGIEKAESKRRAILTPFRTCFLTLSVLKKRLFETCMASAGRSVGASDFVLDG